MKPEVPEGLLQQAAEWDELHRWERSELGKALRRLGLTYGEIREIIPVRKGTLSNWCHDIELTSAQVEAIRSRVPTQRGVPKDTQRLRRATIARIRADALARAADLAEEPLFIAGVVLYWGEGSKSRNDFLMANADPSALRLFIAWVRTYLDSDAEFRLSLHLHEGNDERAAMSYWRSELALPDARFTKTFVKPRGTGHRKNRLAHGVCRVRVCRSADHWQAAMAWIDWARNHMG